MSGSIGEAAADLRRIARDASDASGSFSALYARVTGRPAHAIARSELADGPGMDRFASTFASGLRPLAWLARRLEQRDPVAVVDALLGER
ncbi:MAG TPA: hypothetical protein VGV63_05960 [Acidimicrobiales bacterium]|nr:hypothetical protein [Acidimicrobiales bacterium]